MWRCGDESLKNNTLDFRNHPCCFAGHLEVPINPDRPTSRRTANFDVQPASFHLIRAIIDTQVAQKAIYCRLKLSRGAYSKKLLEETVRYGERKARVLAV